MEYNKLIDLDESIMRRYDVIQLLQECKNCDTPTHITIYSNPIVKDGKRNGKQCYLCTSCHYETVCTEYKYFEIKKEVLSFLMNLDDYRLYNYRGQQIDRSKLWSAHTDKDFEQWYYNIYYSDKESDKWLKKEIVRILNKYYSRSVWCRLRKRISMEKSEQGR